MKALIREIAPRDAERFLERCLTLDEETSFMLLEPGERTTTVAEQEKHLELLCGNPGETIFVADVTHDAFFTGGRLAFVSPAALQAELRRMSG